MTVEVLVCETCRPSPPAAGDDGGGGGGDPWTGAMFAALLQGALAATPGTAGIAAGTVRCLWSCRRPCAVLVRSPGRMGYVLGDLSAEPDAVQALVDYLLSYDRSADGVVAYRDWPEGMKGRFVARLPPPSAGE